MEEYYLRRRLIGAVVLVALGVIFIPMLFSGHEENDIPVFGSNIPSRPQEIREVEVKPYEEIVPDPKPVAVPERLPVDESLPEPPAPEIKLATEEKSEPAAKQASGEAKQPVSSSIVKAWAVQVGSFSNRKNALALKDKLNRAGFQAFVDRVSTDKGVTYRVRVGPEIKKAQAEALMGKLLKQQKLRGLVVQHP